MGVMRANIYTIRDISNETGVSLSEAWSSLMELYERGFLKPVIEDGIIWGFEQTIPDSLDVSNQRLFEHNPMDGYFWWKQGASKDVPEGPEAMEPFIYVKEDGALCMVIDRDVFDLKQS